MEEKVQTIKENYFPKSSESKAETLVEEVENNEESEENTQPAVEGQMAHYMSALTKQVR